MISFVMSVEHGLRCNRQEWAAYLQRAICKEDGDVVRQISFDESGGQSKFEKE